MEISELRRDIVSGAWVVIAIGRGKRPNDFLKARRLKFKQPKETCPFEILPMSAVLSYDGIGRTTEENWWVQVIPNKYPAFGKGICAVFKKMGPYEWTEGVGFHEVVITRDHERSIGLMTDQEAEFVFRAYQARYRALKDDACVEYISIFHNHGQLAGATLSHPHSQIIAIPVVPPDIARSLKGSAEYRAAHGTCVHCVIIDYEIKERTRTVYENERFVVITPYASKTAFEMRVYPKRHGAHFETIADSDHMFLAAAMRTALGKLSVGLKNPDFNFFLHTAPTGNSDQFDHYHWHFEIVPKTAIWAGFEIGTGIEISTIAPEAAAEFLREVTL